MSPRIHVLFLGKAHLPDISEDDALAVYIDEYPPQLVDASDVGATLDSIRAQFTDATFTCSPDLATLAEPRGFVVEPWHPQMLAARAALALKVTYAPRLDDVNPALLASLLKAAARLNAAKKDADRFWRATEHLTGSDGNSRLAVDVAVIAATSPLFDQNNLTGSPHVAPFELEHHVRQGIGDAKQTAAGVVIAQGDHASLEVFPSDRTRAPFLADLKAGRLDAARGRERLTLELVRAPAGLASALTDYVDSDWVPVPCRWLGGASRPVTADECALLVAALGAAT